MKIVLAMPFFDPATSFGGPVVQAWAVAQRLVERGHDVSVVTSDLEVPAELPKDRWVERNGVRLWYASANWFGRRPPYWLPSANDALREALAGADLLYLRIGLTLLNNAARKLAAQAGVPYVYNAEGCLCPLRLREKAFEKWWFLRLIERRVIRDAARLHACTVKEAADYRGQGADDATIDIVPNGVALPGSWSDRPTENDFRQRHSIPAGPIVLYFGRMVPIKGPDVLLRAFAKLREETNAQLVFAGSDGGMRATLESLSAQLGVADRVHFVGNLQGDDKRLALQAASLFSLVSKSEGLPNAALEALAHGLPCLLGTGCNLPEVAEGGAGLVVAPTEEGGIAGLQELLLADDSTQRSRRRAARRLAEERFSIDRIVGLIESSFERVVGVQRPTPRAARSALEPVEVGSP